MTALKAGDGATATLCKGRPLYPQFVLPLQAVGCDRPEVVQRSPR